MGYRLWLDSIIDQINDWDNGKETDLILLRNHLEILLKDVEDDPKYKKQIRESVFE